MSPNHRKRMILVVVSVIAVFLLLYISRNALFPFAIAGIFAYVLFPAVRGLERVMPWRNKHPDIARIAAITLIYIVALAILIGLLALIIPPAVRQSTHLIEDLPNIYTEAREAAEELIERFSEDIPVEVRDKAEEILADLGDLLLSVIQSTLTKTLKAVANTFSFIIGLAIVPVLLFYLLKDGGRLVSSSLSIFPENARGHARQSRPHRERVAGRLHTGPTAADAVRGTDRIRGPVAPGYRVRRVAWHCPPALRRRSRS